MGIRNGLRVVAIDPSGNYEEGKGVTGYVVAEVNKKGYEIKHVGTIKAENFQSRIRYFKMHRTLLVNKDVAVVEDYRLYNHPGTKASVQSNSLMETPRLLGALEEYADCLDVNLEFQMAHQMKPYEEQYLIERGILEKRGRLYYYKDFKMTNHIRSAFKHFLIWFDKYKDGDK